MYEYCECTGSPHSFPSRLSRNFHLSSVICRKVSVVFMILSKIAKMSSAILSSRALPTAGPYPTADPFLFCVYHKDTYPKASNDRMEAPRRGNGQDFNPAAPYRMYHGDRIPGFPQHPHRGFETITATIDGIIDHADSAGNAGRYGQGDVQWMTAGEGVVHSEMFPLIETEKENETRFFQIWINLPSKNKMVKPSFAMFWANEVPKWKSEDERAHVTLFAGHYFDQTPDSQNSPPPSSWANDPLNDVAIMHISILPGGSMMLPKANQEGVNRSLFLIEGLEGVEVDGKKVTDKVILEMDGSKEVLLELPTTCSKPTEFLMLQGKPIDEPVAQYGPFVMNTNAEINQAFADYQKTKFGGWPWPRDDMVFEREKGRFAHLNGVELEPPEENDVCDNKESS